MHGLVARRGLEAVLNDLGDVRPEDRAFRVRMRAAAAEDVTYALADPDRAVTHLAQSLADDADRLRACIDEAPTAEAGLWAAYALHRLTEVADQTRLIYDRLGRPRVEVPGLCEECGPRSCTSTRRDASGRATLAGASRPSAPSRRRSPMWTISCAGRHPP
ncbi:hypothetical protein GLX30_24425 [Streptomyces sp. Tu 2975]|uniref:hypothetical protein n=1 Tax=Streptomyces sp. Tu 2975 TaxID=2676871 RepID=UPI00135AF37E|nr:hypothetical protein [Streptomyces sp. Tu 2975]QIP86639.1 hypothetical protein GLX30_24425 [Streptomyces sp. Tu 2975]